MGFDGFGVLDLGLGSVSPNNGEVAGKEHGTVNGNYGYVGLWMALGWLIAGALTGKTEGLLGEMNFCITH